MSYLKQIWRDLVSGGTALTADRLNHMEDGIAAANDAWDSVSRVSGVVAPASSWNDLGSSLSKEGGDVELVVNIATTAGVAVGDTMATIPAGFRPKNELDFAAAAFTTDSYPMSAWVAVMPDGRVAVKDYLSGGRVAYQFKAVCRYRI